MPNNWNWESRSGNAPKKKIRRHQHSTDRVECIVFSPGVVVRRVWSIRTLEDGLADLAVVDAASVLGHNLSSCQTLARK